MSQIANVPSYFWLQGLSVPFLLTPMELVYDKEWTQNLREICIVVMGPGSIQIKSHII